MEKSMAHVQGVFKGCLEAAVKERLRGKTPEGLGGAASAENAIRDQIAQNIRGGHQRLDGAQQQAGEV